MSNLPDKPFYGKEFNKFFPQDEDDFAITFTQEKEGFALAKIKYQGAEVATMSIMDVVNNPKALDKYQHSEQSIASYPVVDNGSKGLSVLVENRFQIHIRSKVKDFMADHRASVLQSFDFEGLAKLIW